MSGSRRRLKVLVGAYACGPGEGSEPGAGWAFVRAAAENHDVWVVTRQRFKAAIERELALDPALAEHLRVSFLELGDRLLQAKKRPRDVYWYYILWQRKLGRLAEQMHREVRFDVAHHVTFASDWMPCGLRSLDGVPLIWGPVGGATRPPWRLARWLGIRGIIGELLRTPLTAMARRLWGDPIARRAALVVGLNHDVAHRFRRATRVVVEPNSAIKMIDRGPDTQRGRDAGVRQAVFVGRLVGWKGVHLAIAALADTRAAGWLLDFYGDGPERARLEERCVRLGVRDRVQFHGLRPRAEVLAALAEADAMLFPSMHDSAPWAVAEAATLGCPVICLDRGGPPLLADTAGHVVPVNGHVPRALADALSRLDRRAKPSHRWSPDRLPGLVDGWYRDSLSSNDPGGSRE